MKKILFILVTVLFITGCGCKKKEKEIKKENIVVPIEEQVVSTTDAIQGDLQVYDLDIESLGATNIVTGSIMNLGDKVLSGNIKVYLKDESDRTLGVMYSSFNNLEPKKFMQFTTEIMGDYTTVNSYKVVIEDVK